MNPKGLFSGIKTCPDFVELWIRFSTLVSKGYHPSPSSSIVSPVNFPVFFYVFNSYVFFLYNRFNAKLCYIFLLLYFPIFSFITLILFFMVFFYKKYLTVVMIFQFSLIHSTGITMILINFYFFNIIHINKKKEGYFC